MNIDTLWLEAKPKRANVIFRRMTRLQDETLYKKVYLKGINFDDKSAQWLLKSMVHVEDLTILDCSMENTDFFKYVARLPKLKSLSMYYINSRLRLIMIL